VNSKLDHSKEAVAVYLNSVLERGLHYHRQGDLAHAEKDYREILDAAPMHADALHLLGVLSNQKQDHQTAIDLIVRAVQIFPDQPIFRCNLGNAYRDSGLYEQAIACYQKALQLKPDLIETYINLGIAYQQLADLERAASAYQKAIVLKPDSAEAYYNLGNTFKEQGLFDGAIFCYQRSAGTANLIPNQFHRYGSIPKAPVKRYHIIPT
jgi:tetratricopeptide (TPR) repeat protein